MNDLLSRVDQIFSSSVFSLPLTTVGTAILFHLRVEETRLADYLSTWRCPRTKLEEV